MAKFTIINPNDYEVRYHWSDGPNKTGHSSGSVRANSEAVSMISTGSWLHVHDAKKNILGEVIGEGTNDGQVFRVPIDI